MPCFCHGRQSLNFSLSYYLVLWSKTDSNKNFPRKSQYSIIYAPSLIILAVVVFCLISTVRLLLEHPSYLSFYPFNVATVHTFYVPLNSRPPHSDSPIIYYLYLNPLFSYNSCIPTTTCYAYPFPALHLSIYLSFFIMKIIMKNAAESHIPKIATKKKSARLTDTAIDIATQRRELKRKKSTKAEYNQLNLAFQRQARKDKKAYISKICNEIERDSNAGKTRDLLKKIRDITGKFNPKLGGLKNKSGEDITSQMKWKRDGRNTQRLSTWKSPHCPANMTKLHIHRSQQYWQARYKRQYERSKGKVSLGRMTYPLNSCQQPGRRKGLRLMTRLCQEIWDTGDWPQDWKKSVYIPISKEGPILGSCSNNRTIALISHASKILLKIIQGRAREERCTKRNTRREAGRIQQGERNERPHSKPEMDHGTCQCEYQKDLYMCFINYNKAFLTASTDALMWNTLRRMGFPEHITHLLDRLYKGPTAVVQTEFGYTEPFPIGKGVRQGCILSPMLFNLYAEELMRDAGLQESQSGVRIGGRVLNQPQEYADDTTLMAETDARVERPFHSH